MMRFVVRLLVCFGIATLSLGCTKGGDKSSDVPIKAGLCDSGQKVSNGKECSTPGTSPVVMLVLADSSGKAFAMCSGTLITSQAVLTAAHCVDSRLGVSQVYVDRDGTLNLVPASSLHQHPGWSGFAGNPNDIGIVKLSEPILNRPTVPLLLSSDVAAGSNIGIYGYGLNENDEAGTLREGRMVVDRLEQNLIVAEFDRTKMSICSGDSGGPATLNSNGFTGIIAVNSAGSADGCLEGSLAAFASVQYQPNLDFITEQVPDVRIN